jgi:hypothetical protein
MAGTFEYRLTDKEQNKDSYFLVVKIKNFLERVYWAYYVHLPYYLMKSEEAFLLHCFFLVVIPLSVYALFAYLPSSLFHLFNRGYYYVTGDEFKSLLVSYGAKV